jgi:hypothetical protein
MKLSKGVITALVIAAIVLGGFLVVGLGLYSYFNGLQQTLAESETELNAAYLDNQNYLSEYISGFREQVGVASFKADKINQILLDAVRGRYESSGGFAPNGAFFSAIQEAYPDLGKNMDIFDKIVEYVQAKRAEYRGRQSYLLDKLRTYDRFCNSGLLQKIMIKSIMGAPTDMLEARIGSSVKKGSAAREQMYLIVLTPDTKEAYETGVMKPLEIPTATPTPAPPAPTPAVQSAPAAQPTRQKRGTR